MQKVHQAAQFSSQHMSALVKRHVTDAPHVSGGEAQWTYTAKLPRTAGLHPMLDLALSAIYVRPGANAWQAQESEAAYPQREACCLDHRTSDRKVVHCDRF